jgi:hypothetical protein
MASSDDITLASESGQAPAFPSGQDDLLEQDWLLETFVRLANTSGVEMTLTLTSAGLVVTGLLVSQRKWMDLLVANAGRADSSPGAVEFIEAIRTGMEEVMEASDVKDEDQDGPPQRYRYVHLAEAQIWLGNTPAPDRGTLWRGRIDLISGWALGAMTRSST